MAAQGGGSTGANQTDGLVLGNTSFDTSSHVTDASQTTGSAQTAYAPVLTANGGATINSTTSDFGALNAAATIFDDSLNLVRANSADSQQTARLALTEGAQAVREQGGGALSLVTKPFLYAAALAAALIAFIAWRYWPSKKKEAA